MMNTVVFEELLDMSMEMLIIFNNQGNIVFMNQKGKDEL